MKNPSLSLFVLLLAIIFILFNLLTAQPASAARRATQTPAIGWPTLTITPTRVVPGPTSTSAPVVPPTALVPTEECIRLAAKLPADLGLSGVWVINEGSPYLENIQDHMNYTLPKKGEGLFSTASGDMAISPDGTHLAYIDKFYETVNKRAEQRILRVVRSSGHALDMSFWSENWQWLIGWVDNQNLAIATAKGEVVILNPITGKWHIFTQPERIVKSIATEHNAYYYGTASMLAELYSPTLEWSLERSDSAGLTVKNVSSGKTVLETESDAQTVWSADGATLAVVSKTAAMIFKKGRLDASFNLSPLGIDYLSNVKLSPDGHKLTFSAPRDYKEQLIVLDLAQNRLGRACASGFETAWYANPSWSADGRFLVAAGYDANSNPVDVLVDTQEMRAYLLASGYYQHRIAWLAKP